MSAGPAEPVDQSLPAACRLHKRAQFQRVQQQGRRAVAGALVMLTLPNEVGVRRLGVTVSSKVGNSVVRSKIKRWFREIFRKERGRLPPSVDVVMVARASAAKSDLEALRRDFARAAAVFSAS